MIRLLCRGNWCSRLRVHIHKDPVVGGRLGVLLVEAEKYGQAADLLW